MGDIEGRSHFVQPIIRSKREAFIGRVDGGGSTTTRRPWNYGGNTGSGRGSSGRGSSGRGSSGQGSSSVGGGSSTNQASSGSGRSGQPSFLYWSTQSRQWLVASQLGAPVASA